MKSTILLSYTAALIHCSTLYEGSWQLENRGIFFDEFMKAYEMSWWTRHAAKLVHPVIIISKNTSDARVNITVNGGFGMNEKLESLTFEPLCNKRTFFDAELTLCMEESTAKVIDFRLMGQAANETVSLIANGDTLRMDITSTLTNFILTMFFRRTEQTI